MEYSQQSKVIWSFVVQLSNISEDNTPNVLLNGRKLEYLKPATFLHASNLRVTMYTSVLVKLTLKP